MTVELSDRGYFALRVLVNVARNIAGSGCAVTTAAQLRIKVLEALPPGYEDALQEAPEVLGRARGQRSIEMSWEKDMSAAAMMGEPLQSVTAENTWHGHGSDRAEVAPDNEQLYFCIGDAIDGGGSIGAGGRRRLVLVTPAEMRLVLNQHGNWPLFSAAELGGPFEFFRGGDAD